MEHRKFIIASSGISGLPSTIYAARPNNKPLVLKGDEPDEQLTLTTETDNYPGFPKGISGLEPVSNMEEQVERFGTGACHGITEGVNASERPFTVILKNGDVHTADAFTATSGASIRTLGIPSEENLMNYGLSTCATCNGAFFRGEKIIVIGGGDATVEEANLLTKLASTVYLVHRREEFRAENYWVDRLMEKIDEGEIELILNTEVTELYDSPEEGVNHVTLVRSPEGHPSDKLDDPEAERFNFDVGMVFYAIGHTPNADYLDGTSVQRDDDGCAIAKDGSGDGQTVTGVPGIFAAGDVIDYYHQRTATVGGVGVKTTLDVDNYLEKLEREEKQATAGTVG